MADATGRRLAVFGNEGSAKTAIFFANKADENENAPFTFQLMHSLFAGKVHQLGSEGRARESIGLPSVVKSLFENAVAAIREQEKRNPDAPSLFLEEK